MQEIERYFMDRKLGRGVIWVRSTENGFILIDLELDSTGANPSHVELQAPPRCIASLGVTGDDLLYRLSRIAISQVQQRSQNDVSADIRLELNCQARPWNGDLTKVPYGGATIGCAARGVSRPAAGIRRLALHYLAQRRH
jgi:hypothetical protein